MLQMHLMQKCIFATRTFSKVKCLASHFPKENVQHQQNVRAPRKRKNIFGVPPTSYRTECEKTGRNKNGFSAAVFGVFCAALTFCWC